MDRFPGCHPIGTWVSSMVGGSPDQRRSWAWHQTCGSGTSSTFLLSTSVNGPPHGSSISNMAGSICQYAARDCSHLQNLLFHLSVFSFLHPSRASISDERVRRTAWDKQGRTGQTSSVYSFIHLPARRIYTRSSQAPVRVGHHTYGIWRPL